MTYLSMLLVSILVSSVRMARSSLLFNTLSSAFTTQYKFLSSMLDVRRTRESLCLKMSMQKVRRTS